MQSIGQGAFAELPYLSEIVIPGSVKYIYSRAFEKCTNVKSITLGYGVEEISSRAFSDCDRVESVVIPSSVTVLSSSMAFGNMDNLKTVYVDKALEEKMESNEPNSFYQVFAGNTYKIHCEWLKDNNFKASGKTVTVKAKALKKKAKTFGAGSVYKATPAGTVLNVLKVSGSKKISVNKLNGNITVAKKTKKGTYKIKVRVMSTGNSQYKASDWVVTTIKVKVK